jgi:hypothetical protein
MAPNYHLDFRRQKKEAPAGIPNLAIKAIPVQIGNPFPAG